jgi:hypothetical protein
MPAFEADGSEIAPPSENELEHICELGGQFDECAFYLEFFHNDLSREEISTRLGLSPTIAWNAGEPHTPPLSNGRDGRKRVVGYGKWAVKVAVHQERIADSLRKFFGACSVAPEIWRELNGKWDGRIALVGHAKNWNREFSLPRDVVMLIAERGLAINFDAYFDQSESDEKV